MRSQITSHLDFNDYHSIIEMLEIFNYRVQRGVYRNYCGPAPLNKELDQMIVNPLPLLQELTVGIKRGPEWVSKQFETSKLACDQKTDVTTGEQYEQEAKMTQDKVGKVPFKSSTAVEPNLARFLESDLESGRRATGGSAGSSTTSKSYWSCDYSLPAPGDSRRKVRQPVQEDPETVTDTQSQEIPDLMDPNPRSVEPGSGNVPNSRAVPRRLLQRARKLSRDLKN